MLRPKAYIFYTIPYIFAMNGAPVPPPTRFVHKGKKSKSTNDVSSVPVSENKPTAYKALSEYDEILMFIMDDL